MASGIWDRINERSGIGPAQGRSRAVGTALLILVLLLPAACGKKPRTEPLPPPVSSAPADSDAADSSALLSPPLLDIRIEPPSVSPGESALLTWESSHADGVVIEPAIGPVDRSGRIKFFPEVTTTYTVTATGPGGATTRSVTIDVRRVGDAGNRGISREDLLVSPDPARFHDAVQPVFFAFDSAELTAEAREILVRNARWLTLPETAGIRFVLEGHADERGSEEYNLALADQRATVVRDFLVSLGLDPARMQTVSLGEERPFDSRQSEEGWAQNRRTQFVMIQTP